MSAPMTNRERSMVHQLLNSKEAAESLGVSVLTLYDWLTQSDRGAFMIRGEKVTIDYFQGGRNGQGRIKVAVDEIDRLIALMRVKAKPEHVRKRPAKIRELPHINVPLGLPDS